MTITRVAKKPHKDVGCRTRIGGKKTPEAAKLHAIEGGAVTHLDRIRSEM